MVRAIVDACFDMRVVLPMEWRDARLVTLPLYKGKGDKRYSRGKEYFKGSWSQVPTNGGCERVVVQRTNEGYQVSQALKSVLSNRGLRTIAKKCLYEGVIVAWHFKE